MILSNMFDIQAELFTFFLTQYRETETKEGTKEETSKEHSKEDHSKEDHSKEAIPKAPEGSESPAATSFPSPNLHSPQLRKRRSYFGSFLASFTISTDEHAHDLRSPSEDLQPAQLAQRRHHKMDRQMSIGDALSSWMWHHSDPVVPLNESERAPISNTASTDSVEATTQGADVVVVAPKHRRTFNIAYLS